MRYNSKSVLYTMMGQNERPIWQGKPNKMCFLLEAVFNPLLPFALIWAIVDSFMGFMAFSTMKEANMQMILTGFFLIHLMPVWIYIAGVLFSYFKYMHTEFLITDKGVYCSGGIFAITYEHKPYAEVSHINMHRGIIDQMLGVGDVTLTSNHDGYNTRESHSAYRGITICDIPDYKKVYDLLKQLQTDVYADTMYPNDLRPKENHGYNTEYRGNLDI